MSFLSTKVFIHTIQRRTKYFFDFPSKSSETVRFILHSNTGVRNTDTSVINSEIFPENRRLSDHICKPCAGIFNSITSIYKPTLIPPSTNKV